MKGQFILCAVFLVTNLELKAQGVWNQIADYPGSIVNDAATFTIGNYGYVGTGDAGGVGISDFWQFDPSLNVWTQVATFPGEGRWEAVGFGIEGSGFLTGGYQSTTDSCYKDFWEYSQLTNTWTQKPDYPGINLFNANVFIVGSKAFIVAGRTCAATFFTNHLWEYDKSTDSWTQRLSIPTSGRNAGIAFTIDSIGYYGLGMSSAGGYYKDLWKYDPALNIWAQMANYPTTNGYVDAVGFGICQYGYAGTGVDLLGTFTNQFYRYNPISNSWSSIPPLPGSSRIEAMAFVVNNKGYVGGGQNNLMFDDYYEYDPQENCSNDIFSVNETDPKSELTISPNPVSGILNLAVLGMNGSLRIRIYSSKGELIREEIVRGQIFRRTLDVSELSPGLYFINVSNDSGMSANGRVVCQ